jgi:hypothetical protein
MSGALSTTIVLNPPLGAPATLRPDPEMPPVS